MHSVRRLGPSVCRSLGRPATTPARTFSHIQSARALRLSRFAPAVRSTAAFSTSSARWQGTEELVEKLSQELAYEKETLATNEEPAGIKEYLAASEYQLEDVEGSDQVNLVRTYGDETIKVTFSTDSLTAPDTDADPSSDPALYDEEADGQDKMKQAPEDEVENDEYNRSGNNFQVEVTIQVSRPNKGAVVMACFLDSSAIFNIQQMAYYPSAEMAEGKTAEDELAKRTIYTGPPFEELDEDLQSMLSNYIEERGINTAMGTFIPNYIDQKETGEYVKWMSNIKNFLE